jgi:hypothetical protein
MLMERNIGGHMSYCRYDDLTRVAEAQPIGDKYFREKFDELTKAEQEQDQKDAGQGDSGSGSKG